MRLGGNFHLRWSVAGVGVRGKSGEKIKALTLFATHYFELTQLPEKWKASPTCISMHWSTATPLLYAQRAGWRGEQKLRPGGCSLAGVPKEVIKRARQKLRELEAFRRTPPLRKWMVRKCLCCRTGRNLASGRSSGKPGPGFTTPRQALEWIYRLKSLV